LGISLEKHHIIQTPDGPQRFAAVLSAGVNRPRVLGDSARTRNGSATRTASTIANALPRKIHGLTEDEFAHGWSEIFGDLINQAFRKGWKSADINALTQRLRQMSNSPEHPVLSMTSDILQLR
jgi:hypothetical protein